MAVLHTLIIAIIATAVYQFPMFSCDGTSECPVNEIFVTCSNLCPVTCYTLKNPLHINCPRCGGPRCQCMDKYYRNSKGICVLAEDCDC